MSDAEFEYDARKADAPYVLEHEGLRISVTPDVYEPHEDSFLLAEAARTEAFGSFIDLGCGTGLAGLSAATNAKVTEITFADLNEKALELAKENMERNKAALGKGKRVGNTEIKKGGQGQQNEAPENPKTNALPLPQQNEGYALPESKFKFIQTDLFSNLPLSYDTISFNPPYLPTAEEERLKGNINRAFDGGLFGRDVLDKFLKQFPSHLNEDGVLLLLNSSVSAEDGESGNKITRKVLEKAGFKVSVVGKKSFFFEELAVFKAKKTQ